MVLCSSAVHNKNTHFTTAINVLQLSISLFFLGEEESQVIPAALVVTLACRNSPGCSLRLYACANFKSLNTQSHWIFYLVLSR